MINARHGLLTRRRTLPVVAVLAALVVAGCSGDDAVKGSFTSDPAPVPCGGSSAPACAPSPTASSGAPTAAASPTPGNAATFATFARRVVTTKLGDPGVLNVCAVAGSTNTTASKITLTPPKAAPAASCEFDLTGTGVPAGSSAIVTLLQTEPYPDPKPTTTTISGLPVLRFPYEAETGNCRRVLVLKQSGAVTAVSFGGYTKGLAASRMCALSEAVIGRFAAVAAGSAAKPPLSTASPSLLSLDACKVAAAANLTQLPDFAGAKASPTAFSVGCELETSARDFTISSGVLRDASAKPEGTFETVDGHPLYDDLDAGGSCTVTSLQADGETVTISTTAAQPAELPTCKAMATALGEYLHVLQLR